MFFPRAIFEYYEIANAEIMLKISTLEYITNGLKNLNNANDEEFTV